MNQPMSDSSIHFPTEAEHFKVRYQPWLGIVCLLLGAVIAGASLWAMSRQGGFIGLMLIGVILVVTGGLYLSRPYFAIAPNRLTLYNLIGNPVKRYPFQSFSHLRLEKGALYIENSNGLQEKVNIRPWMVKSADWRQLQALSQRP
jgi:hypothetical protein